ncbi:dihydrofolate reductase [Lottiidibacillus patelloidae]|uniref:Dihydrofolate reductase n=1 Tax=Lottiidibacillus patelloidae TaxID=2670334 RepID=A0A263BV38_9BACI|nr:dihydrofolate reductase [Lottiidibacillus patelloidae]OZM57412.1 dihydrofolate reductase [Lottiidibacillus patelloidae]
MISLITCMDKKNTIGLNNKLPWHLPADLKYFKRITTNHVIVMGRKTYESIGKPLPNRRNVVLTRNKDWSVSGVEVLHSVEEVLTTFKGQEVYVIGGEEVYKQFLTKADKLYITLIDEVFSGDAFFPFVQMEQWELVHETIGEKDSSNPYDYKFLEYVRK